MIIHGTVFFWGDFPLEAPRNLIIIEGRIPVGIVTPLHDRAREKTAI